MECVLFWHSATSNRLVASHNVIYTSDTLPVT